MVLIPLFKVKMIRQKLMFSLVRQPMPDPLADPNMGFSACYSSNTFTMDAPAANTAPAATEEGVGEGDSFFGRFSANKDAGEAEEERESSPPKSSKGFSGFPRADSSELLIHIDTSVSLSVNRVMAVISSSDYTVSPDGEGEEEEDLVLDDRILLLRVTGLTLVY